MKKEVKTIRRLKEESHSQGFRSSGYRSNAELNLDPFLNIDLFHMSAPTFPPHPHAGFSAVTYMLPFSKGSFQNRDSFGDNSLIPPGGIHWTQAGRGMMHEETPIEPGIDCHGFQIFVDLAKDKKQIAPRAFHSDPDNVVEYTEKGCRFRILAGSYKGHDSHLSELATQVDMFFISVEPHSSVTIELSKPYNYFIYGAKGSAAIDGHDLSVDSLLVFGLQGSIVELATKVDEFHFLLAGGEPMRQNVVWGGPFAQTTAEDVRLAQIRFQNGEMGYLEKSF